MKDVDMLLKGCHGLKTLSSSKKRSIPQAQTSPYLDIYMMDKEQERLVKECERLEIRHAQIKTRLKEIMQYKIKVHKDAVQADAAIDNQGKAASKDWKKMSLKY